MDNTLSRDGTTPNQMGATLDMNDNRIINVGAPEGDFDLVRKVDLDALQEVLANGAALVDNNLGDLADPSEATANLEYTPSATGALPQSLADLISNQPISVLLYIPLNLRLDIIAGTSTADVTTYLQTALDNHLNVYFPRGKYTVSNKLSLRSYHKVEVEAGSTIVQTASEKQLFYGLSLNMLHLALNGALLYGKGDWSAAWTGAAGHLDRAVDLVNCTSFIVTGLRARNFAVAGLCINGGSGVVGPPIIEGTHNYSTPLPAEANNQMGIYLMAHAPYGAPSVTILAPEISGTAMGVLAELPSTGTQPVNGVTIIGANIHDIPGQHAFYCQFALNIIGATLTNIHLAGVKLQTTSDNNQDVRGFSAVGIRGRSLGSSLFEIAQVSGSASLAGVELQGVGTDVLVGLSTVGRVSGNARINIDGCDSFLIATGSGSNFTIDVKGSGSDNDGFIITATNSAFNIWADVSKVRQTAGDANSAAFNIASASATINIYDPKITAASGNFMKYVFTNKVAGTVVNVLGAPVVSGFATALLLEAAPIKYCDWRSWTPSYSTTSGTLTTMTTNTAKYVYTNPSTISFEIDVTFTDAGTGAGEFFFTLPAAAANAFAFSGFDQLTTGVNIVCRVRPSDLTKASIVTQTTGASAGAELTSASTVSAGRRIIMSGTYHIA